MTEISCNLKFDGESLPLTVGQKFHVICLAPIFESQNIVLKDTTAENSVPKISLLQVLKTEQGSLDLLVTSYKAGKHDLSGVMLYDNDKSFSMNGAAWEVSSVLNDGQEPFPAYSPWELSYPFWIYGAIILISMLVMGFPFWFYFKLQKQKKLQERIVQLCNVAIPLDSFYKSMRLLEKDKQFGRKTDIEVVTEIEDAVRLYLTRELHIPAFEWSSKQILNFIKKKYFKLFQSVQAPLYILFREFELNSKKELNLEFFIEKSQELVELIDRELSLRRKKK